MLNLIVSGSAASMSNRKIAGLVARVHCAVLP